MGDEASKMTKQMQEARAAGAIAAPSLLVSSPYGGSCAGPLPLPLPLNSTLHEQDGPAPRTLIIFDWDDTLLCSSALRLTTPSTELLRQLECAVEAILLTAMSLGQTLIVTNGTESWVQDSATRFVPGLLPILGSLTTVSARAKYERQYPEDPFAWKREAFQELLGGLSPYGEAGQHSPVGDLTPTSGVNLVAIGDSWYEIEAARSMSGLPGAPSSVKTVKFKEVPTVQELLGQLRRSSQELARVVAGAGSASLGLAAKPLPQHLECLAACASAWEITPEQTNGGLSWASPMPVAPGPPCYLATPGPGPGSDSREIGKVQQGEGASPPPPLPEHGVGSSYNITCGWVF